MLIADLLVHEERRSALDAFLFDDAGLVDASNRRLDRTEPWRVAKADPEAALRLLWAPLEAARIAARELEPFVPAIARRVSAHLVTPTAVPPVPRIITGRDRA